MIELWKEAKDCTGCGACYQICPRNAIAMQNDVYGFVFPAIDSKKCIECGACVRVCPMKRELDTAEKKPIAYALRHRDAAILSESSSGGAFTAIAQTFIGNNGCIFGATMNEQLQVLHKGIMGVENLDLLRKSKYVQSDTGKTFIEVREILNKGQKVLYVGTPCQIAGLIVFLGKDYPQLLTCDLVCEGVQSQHFFNEYIAYMEKIQRSTVQSVEFRSKKKHGWERSSFVLNYANGKKYDRICQTKDNAYMNSCLFQGGNRDSCYHCHFDKLPRQGDFTIGDLWGWREMMPEWKDNKGISLVLANTKKAENMMIQLGEVASVRQVDFELAAKKNPNLIRSTAEPKMRSAYVKDMQQLEFSELASKWLKPRSAARRALSHIKYWINK